MGGSVQEYVLDTFVRQVSQIPQAHLPAYLNGEAFVLNPNYFTAVRGGSYNAVGANQLTNYVRVGVFFTGSSHTRGFRLARTVTP